MSGETNIEVIFRIDDTDELLNDRYFQFDCYQMIDLRLFINIISGPEVFPYIGPLWNECFDISTGDIIQYGGDDLVYETKDWDIKVVDGFKKFSDEIGLVWASDNTFGNTLATHGFLSRKWIETLSWVFPPLKLTYANDNIIHNIATKLGRLFYIGEVSIRHAWDGSNPDDPNYGRMGAYFQDSQNVLNGKEGFDLINESVDKLRKVMR